jgi:membrane protease YdiL (CAAX protease family)
VSSAATALARGRTHAPLRGLLLATGLGAAVALRAEVGGADPASSLSGALVFIAALAALALAAGERPGRLRLRPLLLGGGAGLVLVAGSLAGRPVVAVHPYAALPLAGAWTVLVTLVAVAEEALLRGALFRSVESWLGPVAALLLTSAAFALLHLPLYGPGAMPLDFAVGLWLGALRLLTGGWAAPAAAHAVADLAAGWLG